MVRMTHRHLLASIALAAGALCPFRVASASVIHDYVALGDSMAFGETNFTGNPSYGDRGYVKPYADFLAQSNRGVRPSVINLSADGETSTTFFTGSSQSDGSPGHPASQWNLNYPIPAPTQNSLLLSTIAREKAAGHVISDVSIQLGANDLLAAVSSPGFLTMTPAQQQAAIGKILIGVQADDARLLTELKTLVPNASLVMLGYHNPFNADPTSAIGKIADPAIKALNSLIAGEASAFGARYVDTYTPFLGHELAYTYIASGNVHPNAAGYAVIAAQVDAVPEPCTLLVFGAGLAGWFGLGRRSRHRGNVANESSIRAQMC
jgi:lysophospholipase L1-like esterase